MTDYQSRVPQQPQPDDSTQVYTNGMPGLNDLPIPPPMTPPMYPTPPAGWEQGPNGEHFQRYMDSHPVPDQQPDLQLVRGGYQPQQPTPDAHPDMSAFKVFDFMPTSHFGIRLQTKTGHTYIGKPHRISEYVEMRDNVLAFWESDRTGFVLLVEEGMVVVPRDNVAAVTFFSCEWRDTEYQEQIRRVNFAADVETRAALQRAKQHFAQNGNFGGPPYVNPGQG